MMFALLLVTLSQTAFAALPEKAWDVISKKELTIAQGEKATVYVFVSPECPCSKAHEGKLKALFDKFSPQGISFVGVDSYPGVRDGAHAAHFAEARLPFPVVRDEKLVFANELGAQKTPHAFIVKNGVVVYSGGVDSSQSGAADATPFLETALTQIVSGSLPSPSKTRALGCVIARSL